jgi:hypothetical protein
MCSGTRVTSLVMNGFSVSVLVVEDEETEALLFAETAVEAWTRNFLVSPETYLAATLRTSSSQQSSTPALTAHGDK